MDKPTPTRLDRTELQSFLGNNPRLIKSFEEFIRWLAELTPEEISSLQFNMAAAMAAINDLGSAVARAEVDNQAAQIAALSGQVEHLRELLAVPSDVPTLLMAVQAEIASLREGGNQMGLRIRRIVQSPIDITSGNLSATYTITPGLLGPCELRNLGCSSDDNRVAGAIVSLTRAGNVITATRNLTGFNTRVVFEFTEYYP
jgi:hypothetical protein